MPHFERLRRFLLLTLTPREIRIEKAHGPPFLLLLPTILAYMPKAAFQPAVVAVFQRPVPPSRLPH